MKTQMWAPVFMVLQGLLFHVMPKLSRPEIFFGVKVSRDYIHSHQARAILLHYRLMVWICTVINAGLAVYWKRPLEVGLWVMIQFASLTFAWAYGHARVQPEMEKPGSVRTASLEPRKEELPGGIPLSTGPFALLAAAALALHLNWEKLPDRIPVHWGPSGVADRWADSSFAAIYGMLAVGLFITSMMIFFAWATLRMTRQLRPTGPSSDHERRFKRLTALILIGSAYMVALMHAAIAIRPLLTQAADFGSTLQTLSLATIVLLIGVTAVMIWMGQGGSRLKGEPEDPGEAGGDSTPDDCWKLGMFYYNPHDPALLVEKRMGLGWTFNFANGWSWAILGALLMLPLLLPRLLR